MDLIIHHKSCPDGFCAAFVAKKKYPEAEVLGMDHGAAVPFEQVTGKDVLVVDFSWRTREQNIELSRLAKSFRILDHHKTAQATLEGLDFATFDMTRSGAGLAWDYLFGQNAPQVFAQENGVTVPQFNWARPWYVDYVEDRDLWRNDGKGTLPNSNEVNAFIMTLPHTIEAWSELNDMTADCAFIRGAGARAHVDHYVREAVKQARPGVIVAPCGDAEQISYFALVVNALYLNISEVAHELVKMGADIGVGFFERADDKMQFSLRSKGETDVSAIAKAYGGGGHRNAAGFQLSILDGRDLVDGMVQRAKIA